MIPRKMLVMGLVVSLIFVVAACGEQDVLYQKKSPYNTIVVTEDDQGLRTLQFEPDGVRQSVVKVGDPDHIELPYARAMPIGLALVEQPKRVLIIGLGGGTIPNFLHKHYPRATIDVVDIDPDVVAVAKRFFGFKEDATLHAHVADGRKFIEDCRDPYDLIFLDAYGSQSIPYHLATREFLEAVRRALKPEGVVVANVWSSYSNPLYGAMLRTYQEVFPEVSLLDVSGAGNKIFIAMPRERPIRRDDLIRRASSISRQKGFRFDLGKVASYGFRTPDIDAVGRVLTDKKKAGSEK